MSKNLTRKGLALSAVVALGTSLFAGAPAQAAAALNIAPSVGTSTTVLASDTFTTKVFGNADFSIASTTNLRWKITKPSVSSTETITDQAGAPSAISAVAGRADVVYVTPSAVSATLGANRVTIDPSITTATTTTYKVQAYVESDGTLGLDTATEFASAEQTITFTATAVPTLVIDPIGVGVAASATVTYTPAINYDQTTLANTKVLLTQNGTDRTITSTTDRGSDSPSTGLTVGSANVTGWTTVAAGDVVTGVAKSVRFDGDTTYAVSASAAASLETATATTVAATVTKDANIAADTLATDYVVRKGTTDFAYYVQFKKGTTAVAAGQPATIVVTTANLADPDLVKVNGKTVDNSTGLTINTVTAADGKVAIAVNSAYGSASDKITVQVKQGSGVTVSNSFTWTAASLFAVKEVSAPLVNDPSAFKRTIVKGGTLSTSYALVDQFGQKWTSANTATTYRLKANIGSVAGNATWSTLYPDFVSGVAALTITDNSTDNAAYDVSVSVERRQGGSGSWAADSVTTSAIKLHTVTSLSTPSKISLGEAIQNSVVVSATDGTVTNSATRTTATLARFDARVDANSTTAVGALVAHSTLVTGVVKRADGGVVPGASVTLTATGGVYFAADQQGNRYVADGSITVNADETGKYSVYVLSATGGTKSIVITSGAATATQKIKFAAAAANTGSAIKITAPAYTAAGRSVDVSVLLTDKFGAPVQSTSASPLRVTVTGAGSYTTIAADSDADGLVSFKLIFGANETGVATIKATYDLENDATIDLTQTATVTIGSAPVAAATAAVSGSKARFFVSVDGNASAKNVVVKVAGKTVATLKGAAAKKTYTVKATKGSKKVTVYVGGKLIATKTVSVK